MAFGISLRSAWIDSAEKHRASHSDKQWRAAMRYGDLRVTTHIKIGMELRGVAP